MKIYNTDNTTSSCPPTNTVISTGTSIPTLTNVAIIPDNTQTCNTVCTEQCRNLGRFRTLGVANIDPKQSYVCGSTTLTVCGNLEVCDNVIINGTLTVIGDTTLADVSANIIQYLNNSQFFNWGVHIIPISGAPFTLTLLRDVSATGIQTVETPITWGVDEGGWIYPGYGGYGTKMDHGIPAPNTTWSDRSSYPTDGLINPARGWSFAIGLTIPFDGRIIHEFSRFSWTLGRYSSPPGTVFALTISIYIIRCNDDGTLSPASLATCRITNRCGSTSWNKPSNGLMWITPGAPLVIISPGDAIGIYINRNTGATHSPATFNLEIQRDL